MQSGAEQLPPPAARRSIPTPSAHATPSWMKLAGRHGARGEKVFGLGEREKRRSNDTESPSGRDSTQHPVARGSAEMRERERRRQAGKSKSARALSNLRVPWDAVDKTGIGYGVW